MIDIKIPDWGLCLLEDNPSIRYYGFYGGRGGAKSETVGRTLILESLQTPLLILCAREMQNSIQDSVYRLLKTIISQYKLDHLFNITNTYIKSKNGSEFIFKGLRDLSVDSIKSLYGIDRCWVEEAQSISERSFEVLDPTIRKPKSKMIFTFNPANEDDVVSKRFIMHPLPNSIIKKVNFMDNPFFKESDALVLQEKYDREHNPNYDHKWLGEFEKANEAQIFKDKWRVEEFDTPDVKHFVQQRFFFGADWGFSNDPTVLVRCFIQNQNLYIDYEAYKRGVEVEDLHYFFTEVPESKRWKIYGDSAYPAYISHLKRHGYDIESVKKSSSELNTLDGKHEGKGSVEQGISYLKSFKKIIIHPRCVNMIEEFKNYSYKVDKHTGEILRDIVDKYNHGIDSLRYSLSPYILKNISVFDLY